MHRRAVRHILLVLVSLAVLSAAQPSRAAVTPAGPDVLVNTNTLGPQWHPALAGGADGNLFAAWSNDTVDTTHQGVFGRLLSAAGAPLGDEIRLGDSPAALVRVAATADGQFLVSWSDSAASLIRVRRCGADGQPLGPAVALPPYGDDYDLAPLPGGGFVATWVTLNPISIAVPGAVVVDLFDAAGTPQGSPVFVSQLATVGSSGHPRVALDPAGGFAVVWQDTGPMPSDLEIFLARFDAAGHPRPEGILRASDPVPGDRSSPVIRYASDSTFTVAWQNTAGTAAVDGVWVQRFAGGARLGSAFQIAGGEPSGFFTAPAADARGDVLVLWSGSSASDSSGVLGRFLDPAWRPLGDVFQVNAYTALEQIEPAAAFVPGGAVVVWASNGEDGSSYGVYGRRFIADCIAGAPVLCLQGSRFHLSVAWNDPRSGASGTGTAVPITDDTGSFWFFTAANLELMVKVLDGHFVNNHFWVFYGALSDVEYTITVTDTATSSSRTYHNPPFTLASRADTLAFP